MSDRFFVDTNILVYAYDDSAGAKRARAIILIDGILHSGSAIISTQVLQELAICLRREVVRPLVARKSAKIVSELLQEWEVFVNTPESILHALEIEERH